MKRLALCIVLVACGSNHDVPGTDASSGSSGSGSGAGSADGGITPDAATGTSNAAARRICSGEAHSCAILATGAVKCWGYNGEGQLGLGDANDRGDAPDEMGAVLPLVSLGTNRTAIEIACGAEHTCVLLDDHTVKCWGENNNGQLGLGDTTRRGNMLDQMGDHLPAVDFGAGLVPVQIVAGYNASCARFSTGQIKCWGAGSVGQLGTGTTAALGDQPGEMGAQLPFVDVGAGHTVKHLSAGAGQPSVCAILDNDQVKCWGTNQYGQLGLADTNNRGDGANEMGDSLPFVDLATVAVQDVATSGLQACANVSPGKLRCWGQGINGALGNGGTTNLGDRNNEMGGNLGAVPLTGTPRLIGVGGNFACATTTTGTYCWGTNYYGQLGIGSTLAQGDTPGEVAALAPIAFGTTQEVDQLAVGVNQVCALFADGSIRCWGLGNHGQLGAGRTSNIGDLPAQMGAALPVVSLE